LDIKKPKINKKRDIFFGIWIVPITALIVAGWFLYQYYSKIGPEITIEFKSVGNLQEGQSEIRFRDVPVGKVKKIKLKDDNEHVLVIAVMDKSVKPFLNENAKFWIVKPRIDLNGISGLETLVSGSYIQMYSKYGYEEKREFIGLDEPYVDTSDIKGSVFHLFAEDSRNLKVGSPVFYKKMEVGELQKMKLSKDGDGVEFTVFIKAPYDKFVKPNTNFWALDIVSVNFSGSSLNVDIAPASDVIRGGIAFDTTLIYDQNSTLSKDHIFTLFKSKSDTLKKHLGYNLNHSKYLFEMKFKKSISNLNIGSTIEFQGFTVGKVVDIKNRYDDKKMKIDSKVLTKIDLSAFSDKNDPKEGLKNLKEAVKKGLRAKLASSNPILKNQYIELTFTKEKNGSVYKKERFFIFPTTDEEERDIIKNVNDILVKIKNLKLEPILENVNDILSQNKKPISQSISRVNETLKSLNAFVENLNAFASSKEFKSLPKEIKDAVKSTQTAINSLNKLLKTSNDQLMKEISLSLKNINEAAKSLERVLIKVEKKPNSLIMGD